MAVNLINSDDINIVQTNDDIKMNLSEERVDQLSVQMIKAIMSEDYTINGVSTIEMLPLDTVNTQKGTKLTVENGGVKIGKGINYVLASGNVYWYTNVQNRETITYIYKNDSNQSTTNCYYTSNQEHTTLPMVIIPVQEGDIINLRVQAQGAASPLPVIKSYGTGTFLTVIGYK